MDQIKVIQDTLAHTLTVWTGDPASEFVCEETTDEVVLMKDAQGHVIGFELLHFNPENSAKRLTVETVLHA